MIEKVEVFIDMTGGHTMHFPKWFWVSFFAVALVEIGFILLTVFGFIEFNRAADVVRMVVIIIFLHNRASHEEMLY